MTMAFLSRLPTVLEVWAPNPSHFLMEGAFRLVSFLIGSYHPRYCGKLPTPRQPQCRAATAPATSISNVPGCDQLLDGYIARMQSPRASAEAAFL